MHADLLTRVSSASPEDVWTVLSDGWTYPAWVVGATRIHAVSDDFPNPGSVLHHAVGAWPVMFHDETHVLECEPVRRLLLRASGGPLGSAEVEMQIEAWHGGTRIGMREEAISGPGRLVPWAMRQAVVRARNREALLRLALLAERANRPHDLDRRQ